MKRNRILIGAVTVLALVSSISIWKCVNYASQQDKWKARMTSDIYYRLTYISRNLDTIIESPNDEQTMYTLSSDFMELHTTINYYFIQFGSKSGNNYAGIIDFSFISAYTLTVGTGTMNDNQYSGILEDGVISETEQRYLSILKDDIDDMIVLMTSDDVPAQSDLNFNETQMEYMIDTFFDKWTWHDENSPFYLLCES